MNRPIFFSVIIPTYNRANHIAATINSVLAQTYANFEVIVVDDGSTDNTHEIVASLKDTRIRYFWKENEERNIARNYGVRLAKGDYINFLDSDDKQYEHHLQSAYDLLNEIGLPEFLCFRSDFRNFDGELIREGKVFKGDLNKKLIKSNLLQFNAVFIRSDIAQKYRFLEERNFVLGEDLYLWLTLASRFEINYSNIITTTTVRHNSRSLNSIDSNKVVISMELIIKHLTEDEVFYKTYKKYIRQFKASKFSMAALYLAIDNKNSQSVSYLLKALKIYPLILLQKRYIATIKNLLFNIKSKC